MPFFSPHRGLGVGGYRPIPVQEPHGSARAACTDGGKSALSGAAVRGAGASEALPVKKQPGNYIAKPPRLEEEEEYSEYSLETDEALTCYDHWKAGQYTIIPEGSAYLDCWDLIVIIALLLTAIVLPYEVAMVDSPSWILSLIDHAIDITFSCDIMLTFNVAYAVTAATHADSYEKAPLKIARYYMAVPLSDDLKAGWFWLDTLTVMPWEVLMANSEGKSVRLVRVLRLVRMMRLVRVIKLFKRWQIHLGSSYAAIEIIRCLGSMLFVVHWLSCFWAYVGESVDQDDVTWLTKRLSADHKTREDVSQADVFMLALCFVVEMITTVGLGDVSPTNTFEVQATVVTMLFTGLIWAWVVATFVNVITNMDSYTVQFNQLLDDLNGVLIARDIPQHLRWRLRKHLHQAYYVHRMQHQQETIKWLSAGLQGELALESGIDKVCACIWYLKNMSSPVLIDVAQRFACGMFSPNEYIMDKSAVSVIRKGTCFHRGNVLTRGNTLNEDMILDSEDLRDAACAKTVTFVEVMSLTRASLGHVCSKHPDFSRQIRKAQIKLAVFRGIIARSREVKKTGNDVFGFTSRGEQRASEGKPIRATLEDNIEPEHAEPSATSTMTSKKSPMPKFGTTESVLLPHMQRSPSPPVEQESNKDVIAELRALNRRVAESHTELKTYLERVERRVQVVEEHHRGQPTKGEEGQASCCLM